jgi:hypothetical protein
MPYRPLCSLILDREFSTKEEKFYRISWKIFYLKPGEIWTKFVIEINLHFDRNSQCSESEIIIRRDFAYVTLYIYLSIYLSIYLQPFVGPWLLFEFLDFYTVGRTPWTENSP